MVFTPRDNHLYIDKYGIRMFVSAGFEERRQVAFMRIVAYHKLEMRMLFDKMRIV
jgi:hypothetical protein